MPDLVISIRDGCRSRSFDRLEIVCIRHTISIVKSSSGLLDLVITHRFLIHQPQTSLNRQVARAGTIAQTPHNYFLGAIYDEEIRCLAGRAVHRRRKHKQVEIRAELVGKKAAPHGSNLQSKMRLNQGLLLFPARTTIRVERREVKGKK